MDQQAVMYLQVITILNGLMLVIMLGTLLVIWQAIQKANSRLDDKVAEWEPLLQRLDRDWAELSVQLKENLALSKGSLERANSIMDKVDVYWEDLSPQVMALAEDSRRLVHTIRVGVEDFQQSVLPKLRAVSGVAGALREGFGMFQQLRNNKALKRR